LSPTLQQHEMTHKPVTLPPQPRATAGAFHIAPAPQWCKPGLKVKSIKTKRRGEVERLNGPWVSVFFAGDQKSTPTRVSELLPIDPDNTPGKMLGDDNFHCKLLGLACSTLDQYAWSILAVNFLAISIPRRCVDVYQNQGYCIVARSTKLKATSTSKESTIKVHLLPSSEIAGRETAPREADNGTRSSSSSSSSAKQDLLTAAATVAVDLLPLDKNSEATARRRVKSMESQIFAQLLWKRCNEELREEDIFEVLQKDHGQSGTCEVGFGLVL
jgi:hypothetical protein